MWLTNLHLIFIAIIAFYAVCWGIALILTYHRTHTLRTHYHTLLNPIPHPIDPIPTSDPSATQELKPVIRKIISTEAILHIQPDTDPALDQRINENHHHHKQNLQRIINHLATASQ